VTQVVSEFTPFNNIGLHAAYVRAREAVSQDRAISVVDVLDAAEEARSDVALSVYAADVRHIFGATCTGAIETRKTRQDAKPQMALGVAVTGAATQEHVDRLVDVLGDPPNGSLREGAAAPGPEDVYRRIYEWLDAVVTLRLASGKSPTLAGQARDDISAAISDFGDFSVPLFRRL
jgi:hypothetical protein